MIVVIDVTGRSGHIWTDNSAQPSIEWTEGRHSEILGSHLLKLQSHAPIQKLGVITGPGSFTGIRVGISIAMGLAAAGEVELYGYSLFDLAWNWVECEGIQTEGIYFDAVRELVYSQTNPGSTIQFGPKDHLTAGWLKGRQTEPLSEHDGTEQQGNHIPCLGERFVQLIMNGDLKTTTNLEPLYVRPPDAKVGTPLLERLLKKTNS